MVLCGPAASGRGDVRGEPRGLYHARNLPLNVSPIFTPTSVKPFRTNCSYPLSLLTVVCVRNANSLVISISVTVITVYGCDDD